MAQGTCQSRGTTPAELLGRCCAMVVFSCGIHQSGKFRGLPIYEDYFPTLARGSRTSLKAVVLVQFPGGALCRSELFKREFRLVGNIPEHSGILTLLNVVYQFDHRGSVVAADDDSWILPLRPVTSQTIMELSETCTGMGALGLGAEYAGWQVVATNEIQPRMAEVLRSYSKSHVVEGSIEHLNVVASLHAASAGSTSFAFGFSCQPFSRAGDRRGGHDVRSMTLPWGLWTSYMLGCPVVVLECVGDAPKFPFVKLALQQFEEVARHVKSEVLLDISSLLPARRERWWCVFTAAWIGRVTLPELPSLASVPTVSDMFDQLPRPSEDVLEQVTLKDHEIRGLSQGNVSIDQAVVNMHDTLPTALHSWSNQFHACPCECRATGLSSTRLSSKGFFGIMVAYSDPTGQLCYRHLSPQEVGLLNGLPLVLGKHPNSRLEMAGVGQMASPIQSGWVFSAIRRHLGEIGICHLPRIQLRDPLEAICKQLFRIRSEIWPDLPISVAMQLYQKNLMSLFHSSKESLAITEPAQGITKVSEPVLPSLGFVSISPTLAWPTIPGAIPGFAASHATSGIESEFVEPLPVAQAKPFEVSTSSVAEPSHSRSRSRSPRSVPSFGGITAPLSPEKVLSPEIEEPLPPDQRQQPEQTEPSLHSSPPIELEGLSVMPRDDGLSVGSQKAWDYIRSPPQFASLDTPLGESEASEEFQKQFCQLGVGLSPTDLLSDKLLVVDFRIHQFCSLSINSGSTVEDFQKAEAALGNPSFICRDAFGDSLSGQTILAQRPIIVLCPIDLDTKFPGHHNLTRAFSLHTQEAAVANDEMDFYLHSIHQHLKVSMVKSFIVPCLEDVMIAASAWFSDIQCLVSQTSVVSAILLGNHWIPIFVECQNSQVVVHTTSEGVSAWPSLGLDPNLLASSPAAPLMKAFHLDCGFQAFAWLVSKTFRESEATLFTSVYAKAWRVLFWIFLLMHPSQAHQRYSFVVGGHSPEMLTAIATLLREHGVSPDQASSRASDVITALGADRIAKCFQEPRPWASLKQLANSQQPPLRLILPKELQKMVESRGSKKQPVGNKSNKVNEGSKPNQFVIQPSDVTVPAGVFSQQDGTPIGQIAPGQVGSNSTYLVVLSEQDFSPFAPQTIISTEGLAFAIVDPSPQFVEQFGGLTRFPARCTANGEPMLITAVIFQKGQKMIHRATPPQLPSVTEVPVVTVKLMLYRDQCTVPWTTVIEGPVKHLMQLAPCLSVCRTPGCKCPAVHVTSPDSCEPILDLWNRDYVTMQFRKTPAKDADIFACHVRILDTAFEALTAVSGIAGLFVEPREADGRSHCKKHHTFWLPKTSHAEVMQMKQQAKAPAFVVRVAQRYGLKTSVESADDLHEQFRHDTPFLAGLTTTYVIGPLPWGCTRQTLQKLIGSWNWPAKAIQPAGRSADGRGILWHAQAAQAPQHPVITMTHGDVLIVVKDSPSVKPSPVAVEASSHTKECLNASSKEVKPLTNDPWAAAAAQLPGRHPPGLSPFQVQQLEDRIDRKLAAFDVDMPMNESLEPRVKALEDQIARISDAQTQQVATTQALSSQVNQVQQQVEQQGAKFRHHLDSQLADQMSKIEALLSKRPRNE